MNDRYKYTPLPLRGFQIDMRAQMMRPEKMIEVMRDAASWGYNCVLLEYCDKFPYRGRIAEAVAPDALTRDEIKQINAAAKDLGLEIIPLVQCLGHLYWLLRRPNLRHFGEGSGRTEIDMLMVHRHGLSALCPSMPEASELFREMAAQVLEMHPDCRYFHMAGDEVGLDPECPNCTPRRASEGVAGILGSHYADNAVWVRSQGPDPILWCDMILGHPQCLDLVRGKLIVMNWDYWSTHEAVGFPVVRGVPGDKRGTPSEWPEMHRELLGPYFATEEGGKTKPFPYIPFLKERGFQVIVGSGVRSSGDSFCVPKAVSVENVTSAAQRAAEHHLLGNIVTNWALRRAPWPTNEYGLLAAIMTMQKPDIERNEIDARFAELHFGEADPEFAKVPVLLGKVSNPLVQSMPKMDLETAHFYGTPYEPRLESLARNSNPHELFERERGYLNEVAALLDRARPQTDRQRERVAMWHWAHDTLSHFVEFGPQVLKQPGEHDAAELRAFRARAEVLQQRTDTMLRPWLTDWTMEEEHQTRFGIHYDWLDAAIEGAAVRA